VLIVDDDESQRRLLARIVERIDLQWLTATNGAEALALLGEHRVDLVVSDREMGGHDGDELVQQMRLDADLTGTPVIIVTGSPHLPFAGAEPDVVLAKPYDAGVLVGHIHQLLGIGT